MKAVALVELKASPLGGRLDDDEVLRRVLAAMREDPTGLILPKTPQGPSPELLTAQAKGKEAEAKILTAQVKAEETKQKPQLTQMETEGSVKGKTIDLAKTLITHQGDREDAAHGRQVDMAKLAMDAKTHALETTKTAADVMKTQQEAQQGQREHGLAAAQAVHKMGLETRQHGLAEAQAQHQMAKEGAEHGLATAELGHQVGMDHKDRELAERELGVKAATEAEKIGVQKQQADTQRHVALHPPKPAGGAKKPKGKK
jgi:hypothetical protein